MVKWEYGKSKMSLGNRNEINQKQMEGDGNPRKKTLFMHLIHFFIYFQMMTFCRIVLLLSIT